MAGTYIKDAYSTVYKHNSWEKEARDFETSLGVMLYKSPYVINAAQTAISKLSKVLNAYYGKSPEEQEAGKDEDKMTDSLVLGDLAATMLGQPELTKETVDKKSEDETEPGEIEVTDTLAESFLNGTKDSAGQIGKAQVGDEEGHQRDLANLDAVLNGDGNLREKMTMMFNSALLNGGRSEAETDKSVSLKRVFRDVTREDVEANEGLADLDMDSIEKVRKKGSDIFGGDLISRLGFSSIGQRISAFFGFKSRLKRESKPEGEEPGLGYQYYKKLGIKPSKREKAHAVTSTEGEKKLAWKEGKAYWEIDRSSMWAKKMEEKGRILTAGPSGTTQRMLAAYRFLGATDKELLDFRLALIGWMVSSQDHSLYEIMMGSQTVGVKGEEDLSEAAEMYRTIYPLSTEQIRNSAAVEKEFPHERVFKMMLREVARNRLSASKGTRTDKGELTFGISPEDHTAQELAVNMYTTAAYRTMTPSQKHGSKTGKKEMRRLQSTDAGSYAGSMEDAEQQFDDSIYDEIFDVIQVASRISYEGLSEASSKAPEEGRKGEAKAGKLATTAYRGTVYRGEGLFKYSNKYNKVGNTITLESMTSTSKDPTSADNFRKSVRSKWKKPVLLTIQMNGLSGVDVSKISAFSSEQEVLVPAGTKFSVTSALEPDGEGKYKASLEEVSGKDSYLRSVAGAQGLTTGLPTQELEEESSVVDVVPLYDSSWDDVEPKDAKELDEDQPKEVVPLYDSSWDDVEPKDAKELDEDQPKEVVPLYDTGWDDVEQTPELASVLESRKTELGFEGLDEFLTAMENAMSQAVTEDPSLVQSFEYGGVSLANPKFASKLVNWCLTCLLDEEFDLIKNESKFDLARSLKFALRYLIETHPLELKSAPK